MKVTYEEALEQQIETAKRIALENYRFLLIALNLSGNREELETKAKALIGELGLTKALIKSNEIVEPRNTTTGEMNEHTN